MVGQVKQRAVVHSAVVASAQRLLNRNITQRQVAKMLGIGVATVHRIRHGTHFALESGSAPDLGRCPGCGGLLIVAPCMACRDRQAVGSAAA